MLSPVRLSVYGLAAALFGVLMLQGIWLLPPAVPTWVTVTVLFAAFALLVVGPVMLVVALMLAWRRSRHS